MKITFISPYPDVTAFGIRTLSACLKRAGHQTSMIFLPDCHPDYIVEGIERYDPAVLDSIIPICRDSDIIGITLMSNFLEASMQITRKIKAEINKPVIWGGVHPTINPEECLQYADMVCVGDGEDSVVELIGKMSRNEPYWDTNGFYFKKDGAIIRNPHAKYEPDLDKYPMPDYSLDDDYVMVGNSVLKMDSELFKTLSAGTPLAQGFGEIMYQTMTGRGCPHKCTYCMNDYFTKIYDVKGNLRWRSTENLMSELKWIKEKYPFMTFIWISDDSFFARKQEDLREFAEEYKKKIGLPFSCLGSPTTITDAKMEILIDAGLKNIQMGVESGSRRMLEKFNRKHMSVDKVLETMKVINKYRDKIYPPHYDFIMDSPYETDEDKIESLRLISRIPKPYRLGVFYMVLYPGAELHNMASADGIIKAKGVHRSFTGHKGYLNILYMLSRSGRFPGWLLRLFISRPILFLFNNKSAGEMIKFFDKARRVLRPRLKISQQA